MTQVLRGVGALLDIAVVIFMDDFQRTWQIVILLGLLVVVSIALFAYADHLEGSHA
jgi:hypothetical protein